MNILQIQHFSQKTFFWVLALLVLLTTGACSWEDPYQRPNTRKPPPLNRPVIQRNTETQAPTISPLAQTQQQRIVQSALNQVGRPYRYGGNNPNGFDCSGLVQHSYADAGLVVPRTTKEQLNFFTEIPLSTLQAGDLVFFKIDNRQRHVAIMLNQHDFVHAPSSGKTVATSNLSNPYWKSKFLKAARYY